jgi:hypothetical protein
MPKVYTIAAKNGEIEGKQFDVYRDGEKVRGVYRVVLNTSIKMDHPEEA